MTDPEITLLHQQIAGLQKALSAARRKAPDEPVDDYTFATNDGETRLSELFGERSDLIVIHNMGKSCRYCTLWADGFAGVIAHLDDRAAIVLTSPDDPAVQAEFAASRGWPFRMISVKGSTFAHDMGYEPEPGKYWPGVSAFRRKEDGTIVRTGQAPFGPGDEFCSVWHLFDLLTDGADGWAPQYEYGTASPSKVTGGA